MKTRKTPENTPWALISSWLYPTEPANAKRYLGAKAEASQEAARKGALPKRAPSLKPGAKEHPLQHSVQPPQQQQPQQQAQCSRVDTKSLETERLRQESRALKLSLGHRRSSSSSNISSSSIQTQAITLPFPPLPLYPTPVSGGKNTGFGTIGPQAQGCKGAVWMREAGVVQHQQQQQLCEAHSHGQTSPFDHSRAQHPILASAHPPSSTPSYSLPASKFAPSRPQQPTQEASAQASQQTGTDFVPEGGGRMWPGYTQALHQLQCMQAESRRQQERLLCCAAGSMSNSNKHGEEGSAASCSSCGSGSCSQRGVCGKQWESSWHEQIAHMISQILAQQQLQCDLWDILQMTQQPYLYQQHHQRQQHSQKASSLLQPPDQGVGSNSAESSSARGSEVVGPPRGDSCSWDGPQQEWDSVTSVPVSPPCLAAVNAEGPGLLSLHSQQQQQQSHASSLADKEEQQQQQQQQQQRQQQGQQQQGQAQPKDELLSRKEQGTPQQQQQHQQLENTKQEPEVQLLMQQQILELQLQQNRELHEEQQLLQHNPCTAFQALLMEHVHLEAECEDLKAHILALTDDLHRSQQEAEAGSSATQQLQQVLCALDSSLNDLHTEHAATKAALAAATAENAHLMTLLSSKHEGSCMLLPALGQATAQPVAGQ